MAFKKKYLDIGFTLGTGQYGTGAGAGNKATLSGLRASAKILKAGGTSMPELSLTVYGMTLDMMNKLTTIGMVAQQLRRNVVTVNAYEDGQAPNLVFQGTIFSAWLDPASSPETAFRVEGQAGLLEAVQPVPPTSYPNGIDAAKAMQTAAGQMGLQFKNDGVKGINLPSSYFSGAGRNQAAAIAEAAGISWLIDNGTLTIWPLNQHRSGSPVLVTPGNGLVGYPTYTSSGIRITTLFNPAIDFYGQIQIQGSQLVNANNTWTTYRIDYDLESNLPGGRWFSTIDAFNPAYPPPVAL